MKTKSSLATQVKNLKDMEDRPGEVYGLCVHQTGSGIVEQALKYKIDPLEHAVNYYLKPDSYSAHYVCGYDGSIIQLSDEKEKCFHVGFSDRKVYLSGEWEKKVAPITLQKWKENWPNFKTPAHLFPGPSPNAVYIGVEMIPLTQQTLQNHEPMHFGSIYTLAQHQAIVMLARDIAERHGLPDGWQNTSRLVGHEDLTPISRSNKKGGWDPGYLKDKPWFDMNWVRAMCGE